MDVLAADPVMEPREAECIGRYLYGSGYYAREDQQAAILLGRKVEASFCNECPVSARCQDIHRRRVADEHPEDWATYTELVRKARRRGVSEDLVEAALMKQGKPSPLMAVALVNYRTGVEHRRRVSGSSIIPSARRN